MIGQSGQRLAVSGGVLERAPDLGTGLGYNLHCHSFASLGDER